MKIKWRFIHFLHITEAKMKKFLALILSAVTLLTVFPAGAFATEGTVIAAGDHIEFGSYPQFLVEDEAVLAELDKLTLEWELDPDPSYQNKKYFADTEYDGEKYRAVKLVGWSYGEERIYYKTYELEKVYWFKYKPINWIVLNPSTGLCISSDVIDAGAFDSYAELSSENFVSDKFSADYCKSTVREKLNTGFYNTAFSTSEKEAVLDYTIGTTENKVFLFSSSKEYDDVFYPVLYGAKFYSQATDYACIDGAYNDKLNDSDNRYSNRWFRDSENTDGMFARMFYIAWSSHSVLSRSVYLLAGLRPGICIDLSKESVIVSDKDKVCQKNHGSLSTVFVSEPTCIATGLSYTECSCGTRFNYFKPKIDHSYVIDAVLYEPEYDCLADRIVSRHCEQEGCTYTDTYTYGKAPHEYAPENSDPDEKIAPTCLTWGKKAYYCKKGCGTVRYIFIKDSMLSHDYSGDYVDNGDGTHSRKCVNGCKTYKGLNGVRYLKDSPDPLSCEEHVYSELVSFKPATCVSNRTETKKCVCGAVKTSETENSKDLKNHSSAPEVTGDAKAATCGKDGYTGNRYCTACGTLVSKGEVIDRKTVGHTSGGLVIENYIAPTAETKGSLEEVVCCTVCGAELSRNKKTFGKLTVGGYVEEIIKTDEIPQSGKESGAKGGDAGEEKQNAYKAVYCYAHDKTGATSFIHTPGYTAVENLVAATAEKEGSCDEVVYCHYCNAELSRNTKTLPKTETYSVVEKITPAENGQKTEDGKIREKTVYCNTPDKTGATAVMHTPGVAVIEKVVLATEDKEGSYDEVVYCTLCGKELSRKTLPIEKALPEYGPGDVDDDMYITLDDARVALRIAVYLDTPDLRQQLAADVDGVKGITVDDARAILRVVFNLEPVDSLKSPEIR